MTKRQKIELRLSEVRKRLNEISDLEGDALTDEIRTEADTLKTEFGDLETRFQAATIAEPDPEPTETRAGDREAAELADLTRRASAGDIFTAALVWCPGDI